MAPTVIVTGSSRGIGKAIALRLAADGYDVCVNDVAANQKGIDEVVGEIKALGRNSIGVVADVSKRAEVDSMVQESVAKLGELNTMVANAGIAQVKALLDLTDEDWDRMLAINVKGVHNCYAAAATQFMAQGPPKPSQQTIDTNHAGAGGGIVSGVYKIIGAASIVAFKPFPMLSHYSASKWAVKGLTQAFAMEMANICKYITVNCYAPGIVGTAMWDLIDEGIGNMRGAKKGDTIKKYSDELISMGRVSVPEDVSNAVHYLASGDSDYMTGQTMVIDGGIVFS